MSAAGGTINVGSGVIYTAGGVVSSQSQAALTVTGGGTVILTNTGNTYGGSTSGPSTIIGNGTNGTLSVSSDGNLGTAPSAATAASITFNAGTLVTSSSFTLNANRGITLSTAGTISPAGGTTLAYGGTVAGSALTVNGAGTFLLYSAANSNTNTYGSTTIGTGSTLAITNDNDLGTAAGTVALNGGTLRSLALNPTTGAPLSPISGSRNFSVGTGGGTLSVDEGQSLLVLGDITGTTGLTVSSGGTVNLGSSNGVTGGLTITGNSTALLTNNNSLGNQVNNVTVNAGSVFRVGNVSQGGSQLFVNIEVLNGTGLVYLDLGTGGTVEGTSTFKMIGPGSGTQTIGNVMSGTVSFVEYADGVTRILTAQSTYTGGATQINNGSLKLGVSNALPIATVLNIGSGGNAVTFDLGGFNQQLGGVNTSPQVTGTTSTQVITNSGSNPATLTVSGITGNSFGPRVASSTTASSIIQDGTARTGLTVAVGNATTSLALSSKNTYTGNTTINGGGTLTLNFGGNYLAANEPTSILSSSTEVVLGGGTLNVQGSSGGTNTQTFTAPLAVKAGASVVTTTQNGADHSHARPEQHQPLYRRHCGFHLADDGQHHHDFQQRLRYDPRRLCDGERHHLGDRQLGSNYRLDHLRRHLHWRRRRGFAEPRKHHHHNRGQHDQLAAVQYARAATP